jgi:hypothetical protein
MMHHSYELTSTVVQSSSLEDTTSIELRGTKLQFVPLLRGSDDMTILRAGSDCTAHRSPPALENALPVRKYRLGGCCDIKQLHWHHKHTLVSVEHPCSKSEASRSYCYTHADIAA